jgi:chemotaxis methyl-accepting protein methylase
MLEPAIRDLLRSVHEASGLFLDSYREATLKRRIRARQALLGLGTLEEYLELVSRDPLELRHLAEFLLIPTTEMFRDIETFSRLRNDLLPALVARRVRDGARQLRIWSAGCSTGEEAFSLAACAAMEVERHTPKLEVSVLASDVSTQSLERAARGMVPDSRATHVPSDIRSRFLTTHGTSVRISDEILSRVTFSRHDLLDPNRIAPSAAVIASFDIVSCRNVLIYLEPYARQKALDRLLKSCAPWGIILLGSAEALPASVADLAISTKDTRHAYIRRAL